MARSTTDHTLFEERKISQSSRGGDSRAEFTRDKGRIIHSSAFRKLQSKTQVSDPVEGDFHRTRLTHSLETAQIGEGIVNHLMYLCAKDNRLQYQNIKQWIPPNDLICAACYAHDIGHPPYGHTGERELDTCYRSYINGLIKEVSPHADGKQLTMLAQRFGGFEANAQTLRLLTSLVPYKLDVSAAEVATAGVVGVDATAGAATAAGVAPPVGLNLTRRTLLAVLKYPKSYSSYARTAGVTPDRPVKCYYGLEERMVEWLMQPFSTDDTANFLAAAVASNYRHHDAKRDKLCTFDCSIMDYADEIAYSTHDIEDSVARGFLSRRQLEDFVEVFQSKEYGNDFSLVATGLGNDDIDNLFSTEEANRKAVIAKLINLFITSLELQVRDEYEHPLLSTYLSLPKSTQQLLNFLREVVKVRVINSIPHKMLESRANMMIHNLFERLVTSGAELIPRFNDALQAVSDNICSYLSSKSTDSSVDKALVEKFSTGRVIIDYISSMTDSSLLRSYNMLFTPGYGSSKEELLA